MSDPEKQFEDDAIFLAATERLADIAVELVGEHAGSALLGAAMKAWERDLGNEHALALAERSLRTITEARSRPSEFN